MRALVICLLIAGCASNPADLVGKSIDDAISQYGYPKSAVDYEGARAFFFEIDKEPVNKKKNKKLLDPDMPILNSDFKTSKCVYTMNALYTNSKEEWTIHSIAESTNCKGKK